MLAHLPFFSYPLSKQVCVTAETTQPAPTVRGAAMGTMAIPPRAARPTASPARALGARAAPSSRRRRRWCAPAVLPAPPVSLRCPSALQVPSYRNTSGSRAGGAGVVCRLFVWLSDDCCLSGQKFCMKEIDYGFISDTNNSYVFTTTYFSKHCMPSASVILTAP